MEENQSVDALSAHTVGKGYLDAVTLIWSPSTHQHKSKYVLTFQLYTATTIETRPSGTPGVVRYADTQLHAIRK
jgi:hypothetical protein